jgi:hypothetical protein
VLSMQNQAAPPHKCLRMLLLQRCNTLSLSTGHAAHKKLIVSLRPGLPSKLLPWHGVCSATRVDSEGTPGGGLARFHWHLQPGTE